MGYPARKGPPGRAPGGRGQGAAAGSFKTLDAFGNLQLTFFKDSTTFCADVDIDDAAGLGHVLQVVRNSVTKSATHPFNINQILIKHQNLAAGYRLVPNA